MSEPIAPGDTVECFKAVESIVEPVIVGMRRLVGFEIPEVGQNYMVEALCEDCGSIVVLDACWPTECFRKKPPGGMEVLRSILRKTPVKKPEKEDA